jgi:hypothetical protein
VFTARPLDDDTAALTEPGDVPLLTVIALISVAVVLTGQPVPLPVYTVGPFPAIEEIVPAEYTPVVALTRYLPSPWVPAPCVGDTVTEDPVEEETVPLYSMYPWATVIPAG